MMKEKKKTTGTGILTAGGVFLLLIGITAFLFMSFKPDIGINWPDENILIVLGMVVLIYHIIFALLFFGISKTLRLVSQQPETTDQDDEDAPSAVEVFLDISTALLIAGGIIACIFWFPEDKFSGGSPIAGIAVFLYHIILAMICFGFRELFKKVSEVQRVVGC
ncbi:MAG: hypothetical protein GY749_43450 [Desulfobacteraceae bacterium]|nr:hypothetical protein [Desulfobacteraceae bacterium]